MAAPVDAGSIFADVRIRLDKLNGDVKSVQTSLDKITKKSNEVAKKSKSGLSKFFSFIKSSGVGAFLALGAVIAGTTKFLKESEQAASDAQEVYSKFDTVFESIQDTANQTAEDISESFGIAGSTARELLSATGDLLVGFGFTEEAALSLAEQTVSLGSDLASFTNFEGGAQRATEALNKALVGESESVKALGIVIRQDTQEYKDLIKEIRETNDVSLTQAKALAALQIATEQSGKAIGDYERTMDSAANVEKRLGEQTKELQEAVGKGLLPTVTAIRKRLGEWAEAITEVLKESNKLRDINKAVDEGTVSLGQRIEKIDILLKREKENLELLESESNINKRLNAVEVSGSKQRIANLSEQIVQLERLKKVEDIKLAAIKAGDKTAEAIAARKEIAVKAELAALEELTKRQFEALSPAEQRLELIRQEIDALALTRAEAQALGEDWGSVQDLINDLHRERTKLIREDQSAFETSGKSWLEIEQEKIDHLVWIDDLETEIHEKRVAEAEERQRKEREEIQKRIALISGYANAVTDIFTAINDLQSATANAELARLKKNGATEEELAEKKKELEIEAAKRGKALALLNIAINTASAVVAALVSFPPNVPLSIAVGVTGAIQAAAVAAEPIPSFATGGIVKSSPGGTIARVAENNNPELMLNAGAEGQALLSDFAAQIVAKMGGGRQIFQLMLPNGRIIAETSAPFFNNGNVPLKLGKK